MGSNAVQAGATDDRPPHKIFQHAEKRIRYLSHENLKPFG